MSADQQRLEKEGNGMATATGTRLSAEVRVLDVAHDILVNSSSKIKNEVAAWAMDAFQNYLAAGSDEREFSKKLPRLLRLLRGLLASLARDERKLVVDSRRNRGKVARGELRPDYPIESEDTLREAEENAAVADALIARMREAPR